MMYIEHTPLEDNLQYTLRNSAPTSATATASVLLSQVHEAEEAATHLHLQAQSEIAAAFRHAASDYIKVDRAGSGFVDTATRKLEQSDLNNHLAFEYSPNANSAKESAAIADQFEETPNTEQKTQAEEVVAAAEYAEDIEHYELIDVFDADEDLEVQETKPINLSNQVESDPQTEIIVQIDENAEDVIQDDNFEYVLTRVPKSQPVVPEQFAPLPTATAQSIKRRRRPPPAAIPIDDYVNYTNFSLRQTKSAPGIRVLNGTLPIFRRRSDSRTSSSRSSIGSARYPYNAADSYLQNGYVTNDEYETQLETDRLAAAATAARRYAEEDSQMGFKIWDKFCRILNLIPSSNYDTQENSRRKRRFEDITLDAVTPQHHFKYRKVESHFPKIYNQPLDDDDVEVITPFPPRQSNRQLPTQQSFYTLKNSLEMTTPSNVAQPRKSLFASPQTTHKLIKNTSFADIEFSDDDEPELIKGFGIGTGGGTGASGIKKAPQVFHIPIRQEQRPLYASKLPPPPLIETRTGSILASSLSAEHESSLRKPTYAEALRQQRTHVSGHVLGGRGSSSNASTAASTSTCVRGYNSLSNIRTNPWATNARSILAQEKETEEREKYQQLLEQVVPRLYGVESNASQLQNRASNHSLERRRNAVATSTARSTPVIVGSKTSLQNNALKQQQQQPLSSTINLEDDEDNDDDVKFTGISTLRKSHQSKQSGVATVIIDDDDISDIIDLGDDERHVLSACAKINKESSAISLNATKEQKQEQALPYVEPVNSLLDRFNASPHLKENWLEKWELKWNQKKKSRLQEVNETVKVAEKLAAERRAAEVEIQDRLRKFQIVDPELLVIDDFPEPVVEEEPEFIELTADHQARIKAAICGPPDQVLVSKFNLNITRRDIHTLLGHNWLNDEVINFYMNLLTERGEKKHDSHGLPLVYAMNTFFVPRLMQAGHGGVKRWTRKVDIFTKDVIPVPVHVGGVHWCMAIIHLKNRTIKYYDSMGTPNPSVLKALEQYLKDESLDKRKQPFDTSQFEVESVRDVPRQMNGSDCGVFSCMFAEYITRNREITFSQQNMEYFRHKMILEIVQGELLH